MNTETTVPALRNVPATGGFRKRHRSVSGGERRSRRCVITSAAAAGGVSYAMQLAAHELATPLTTIALNAQTLSSAPGAIGLLAHDIYDQTMRLQVAVSNLLDLGRVEHLLQDHRPDECAVHDLAAAAIRFAEPGTDTKAIAVEIDTRLPSVQVDRPLAERALANVIRNALQHGAPPVSISAIHSGPTVSVLVADSGNGIDPRRVESDLFRPFRPFGPQGRVGLGLWLSREVMRRMGGDLSLRSARPTCFQIDLPRLAVDASR